MSKNRYVSGQWNVICDVCGKKIKAGEAKHRWDGFIVCPSDFEQRHSQDFVRARQDKISVPFTRPIPTLIFTDNNPQCTLEGQQAIPSWAIPGCMVPGKYSGNVNLYVIDGYYIDPPNLHYIEEVI